MKTMLNEWRKNKKATFLLIMYAIIKIAYLVVNARIVVVLAEAVEGYQNLPYHLTKLALYCIAMVILSPLISETSMSRHHIFTSMSQSFCNKILGADYEMFTKISCSNINTTFNELWTISNCGRLLVEFGTQIANLIINLVSIYLICPSVSIPIIIIYLVCAIICRMLFKMYEKLDDEMDSVKRNRTQEVHEIVDGFAEVRGFCTQNHHLQSIIGKDKTIMSKIKKRTRINSFISCLIESIDSIAILVAIVFAGNGISNGTMSAAVSMSLVMYIYRLVTPLTNALNILDELSPYLTVVKRYDEVMNYKNEPSIESITLDSFNDSIDVKDVSFKYSDSDVVLQNINMNIKKGTKIGICGSSGGGKTTLIKLMEKFYNPTSGSISIDGIDMRELTTDSVRGKMGMVHQDPHIFSDTIYQNIVYGNWECSEYEVIEACKKANIYDFIQGLPEKFQTQVGPKGLKLSGGQKQRIALARIFLKDPEIVLLDEATSALDNESEALIQDALDGFKDKTVITIAHRLSTIKDSDVIYVIENHKVVESGSHEELMNVGGRYSELVKISEKNK